jgi:hypothetical protein
MMTDRLTDYVKMEPTHSTATARDIAKLVYSSWYRQSGLPQAITSDRDKLFIGNFWKESWTIGTIGGSGIGNSLTKRA